MVQIQIRHRMWMIAAALIALAGCGSSKSSNFYQLDEPAATRLDGLERGLAVGVGPVNLEPYLDRPQIVIRGAGHKLDLSEFNRWVEPLNDSISRVLVVSLSNMLESTRVYKIPRRNKTIPLEFRVEIDIARFDGMLGGDALLVSRWTLYGGEEEALQTKVSIIRESSVIVPTESSRSSNVGSASSEEEKIAEDYERLIAAQNRTLQKLCQEIVDAINENR